MKGFGYIRISLENEKPENQEIAIREFARANGIELLKVYRDIGISGGKPALERPEFTKMVRVAEELEAKNVIVYDLTRFGRDLFDVIRTMHFLMEKGFNIFFVKHPELNISREDSYVAQTMRKAMLTLLATFAEMERSFIRERTKQGMKRAKEQGKCIGRPPFPEEKVRSLLKQGKTIKDVWRLLKERNEICREVKGKVKWMSYEQFRRKVKKLAGK